MRKPTLGQQCRPPKATKKSRECQRIYRMEIISYKKIITARVCDHIIRCRNDIRPSVRLDMTSEDLATDMDERTGARGLVCKLAHSVHKVVLTHRTYHQRMSPEFATMAHNYGIQQRSRRRTCRKLPLEASTAYSSVTRAVEVTRQ